MTETRQYRCSRCRDTGFILTKDEQGLTYAAKCSCQKTVMAERYLRESGIRPEDRTKGFKNFRTLGIKSLEEAKKRTIQYYMDFQESQKARCGSILFTGASGRGKTTLGMALANNFIRKKNIAVKYMPYREELTRLKQEITDETAYRRHMDILKNTDILFLDDLLKGKTTESDLNILYEIINHRYLAGLPMIISTEKSCRQLVEFDEAVGSRLIEMCRGYIIHFDGDEIDNYRLSDIV